MTACIIPSYIKHIQYLDRLFYSIGQCSIKPDLVVLAASEVNEVSVNEYDLPVVKLTAKHKRNRAQNLNVACNYVLANSPCDIISILDSDDLAHHQRFEFILDVFKDSAIDVVVHNFHQTNEPDLEFIKKRYKQCSYKKDYINTLYDNIPYPTNPEKMDLPDYANGHVSFRKWILDKIVFTESAEYEYMEDSKFNREIVESGIMITYIENKLSNYIKNPNR